MASIKLMNKPNHKDPLTSLKAATPRISLTLKSSAAIHNK
jgi:hypothetical protein